MRKPGISSNYPQTGFTLIELIAVIVLLGILTAVAVPKFIDLKEAAIEMSMEDLVGAVKGAANMAYAKAIVEDVHQDAAATITVNGLVIDIAYGYPTGTATGIDRMINQSGWQKRASVFAGAWVYWHGVIQEDAGAAQCYIRYRQPTVVNTPPVVDVQTSGC
ncbi:type II secretion system protein [Gilvimarinus sp. SDUM040013]|uniref:Type II secretion system protein n=1 Tax=Gilvimarinus gilvus TaxID=3058038 RepID=A0ABU4S329_9GAMM|nr:type II secretion system protein [Gilvimarinus sp. SDUM040013]MDO3384637.1 type II secretion system protein [Gilvimarinus sp. SDUM040013]MDX6850223.1 type II secretion system protein [Gilvimarinus sp. SDUM040013]